MISIYFDQILNDAWLFNWEVQFWRLTQTPLPRAHLLPEIFLLVPSKQLQALGAHNNRLHGCSPFGLKRSQQRQINSPGLQKWANIGGGHQQR